MALRSSRVDGGSVFLLSPRVDTALGPPKPAKTLFSFAFLSRACPTLSPSSHSAKVIGRYLFDGLFLFSDSFSFSISSPGRHFGFLARLLLPKHTCTHTNKKERHKTRKKRHRQNVSCLGDLITYHLSHCQPFVTRRTGQDAHADKRASTTELRDICAEGFPPEISICPASWLATACSPKM